MIKVPSGDFDCENQGHAYAVQRPARAVPALDATAESLPFDDYSLSRP